MKKGIRISLQVLLFVLSHTLLLLSDLFPNKIFGIIIISIIFLISTYYLWNNTTRETLIKSLLIFITIEFFIINGQDGLEFIEKSKMYFGNLINWVLPGTIIITITVLLIKILVTPTKVIKKKFQ